MKVEWLEVKSTTFWSQVHCPGHYACSGAWYLSKVYSSQFV